MKETYNIILFKLIRDKMNVEQEISELLENDAFDTMSESQCKMDRYQRLLGKKYYIMDLIQFFEDIKNHLD